MCILRLIDKIADWSGKILSLGYIPLIAVLSYETVVRYALSSPTQWAQATSVIICGLIGVVGGMYSLRWNAHVRMDLVYSRLTQRGRAIVDLLTSFFFFFFVIILIWKGTELSIASTRSQEVFIGTFLRIPVYPLKWAIPVAGFMVLLQGSAKFVRDLLIIMKKLETATEPAPSDVTPKVS